LLWLFSEDSANCNTSELQLVKAQLAHKSELLDKVKVLLQRAAAKEKMLHDKVRSGTEALASFRQSTTISGYPNCNHGFCQRNAGTFLSSAFSTLSFSSLYGNNL
jgi:hypothetical protein